jgi:Phage capsid family.
MDGEEIKSLLTPIHDGIKGMQATANETKQQQEQLSKDFEETKKAWDEWQKIKDSRDEKNQQALDDLAKKASSFSYGGKPKDESFEGQLKVALFDHYNSIKEIRKGKSHAFEIKASMLESTHLTGNAVVSYLQPSMKPGQGGRAFRDLVEVVNTATGWITIPRETTTTGSVSRSTTEGATKSTIEYAVNMVNYTADYIAGFARISKQMLTDLPFLQTWLPRMLIRDFTTAENAQFYGDLIAAATGSTTTSATIYAEKLIDWMATLGAAGYQPNGIVGTFAEWASLMKTVSTSGTAYSVPGSMVIDPSGTARIAGVPFYPAGWVASGKTITGDWSYATIAVADPLKVEFFEEDSDNVQKNLITVRVEAREVLVIEQPAAFIYA